MSVSSSWWHKGVICLLAALFSLTEAHLTYAGQRRERNCSVSDGWVPCPPRKPAPAKPDPEKDNQAYTAAALHAVFAAEEKQYGNGLTAYLNNTSGGPYVRALALMRQLRQNTQPGDIVNLNAKKLEGYINAQKPAFIKNAGLEKWFAEFTLPRITGFSPASGIVGDEITITGENLGTARQVKFVSASGPVTVVSNTELRTKVPDYIGSPSFPVAVVTQFGTAASPAKFNLFSGNCTYTNITQVMYELNLRQPRGDGTTGECNLSLYGNESTQYPALVAVMANTYGFVKREPPKISAVAPLSGGVGQLVRIDGNNFYQVKAVYFDNTPANFYLSQVQQTIMATVPATGGKISVVTYSGADTWPNEYTVLAPPKVNSIAPAEIISGGTFRISGQNFDARTAVNPGTLIARTPTDLVVKLESPVKNMTIHISASGGEADTSPITVWSGICDNFSITKAFEELLARRPLGQKNEAQCNPDNYHNGKFGNYEQLKFAIRQRYGYVSRPAPTITGLDPAQPVAGEDVWIYGTNFYNVQGVIFGSNSAEDYKVHTDTKIRAKIRFGSGSGDVVVSTLENVARFPLTIMYPPYIGGVNPKEALPGVAVRLTGSKLAGVQNVLFGETAGVIKSKSDTEIVVAVPKGPTGRVTIAAQAGKMSGRWDSFGIVTARLAIPNQQLRNLRVEIIGPDGKLRGSAPLIGNSGVSFSGAVLDQLIGNAGAGLTANVGGALTGNTPLTSNVPLSIHEIAALIGNAGAGLIGNAGAGLTNNSPLSLGNLIGNAGAGLSNAQVTALIGNAGAGLIGNAGAGLAGNAGSSLIGNAGAGLVDGALSLITRRPADLLLIDIKNLAGNAGSSLKLPTAVVNIAPPKIDLSVGAGRAVQRWGIQKLKETPAADKYKIKPADTEQTGQGTKTSDDGFGNQPLVPPVQTYVLPPGGQTKGELPKPSPQPTPEPTKVQPVPTPVVTPKVITPAPTPIPQPSLAPIPTPAPTPTETKPPCPAGSTYSFTFGTCMEDAPQKLSPYDGLPCPDNVDSIPAYATKGCIPQ